MADTPKSESKRGKKLSEERIEIQQSVLLERLHQLVEFLKKRLGSDWAGHSISTPQDLIDLIGDGVLLCRLVGKEPSTSVNSDEEETPLRKNQLAQYNINMFQEACLEMGVRRSSLFSVSDLLQPSSLSAMCVINGLTELRLCILEKERKQKSTPCKAIQWDKVVGSAEQKGSPQVLSRSAKGSQRKNGGLARYPSFTSPLTRESPSKGLLHLISDDGPNTNTNVVVTPRSPSESSENRRVSINSINAQASVARVQERIASSFKAKCKSLGRENHELHASIEDLQETIKTLTKSKADYKSAAQGLQHQCNTLKKHLEERVRDSFERIVKEIGRQRESGEGDLTHLNKVVNACIQSATLDMSKKDSSESGQVDELCKQLESLSVGTDNGRSTEKIEEYKRKLADVESSRRTMCEEVRESLATLKYEFGDLSNDFRNSRDSFATELTSLSKTLQSKLVRYQNDLKSTSKRLTKETNRRKQLLNMVHHLKGNIRVLCRIRPKLADEKGNSIVVKAINEETVAVSGNARGHETHKQFEFDRVFGPADGQSSVFDEVEPLVESVLDGYQSCIFAYGQTGSGKTYTMSGDGAEHRGINYLALEKLFEVKESSNVTSFKFKVCNVEIYCEHIIDLLCDVPEDSTPNYLDLREGREGVFMPGCTEVEVNTVEEVIDLMDKGSKNRSASHTKMNAASSRSHSIVMISVEGQHVQTRTRTMGRLVLVDLAGSERVSKSGVSGKEMKEAQHINKSLSCLGDVIAALESKSPHIPFRNSKLTSLLKNSLGKDNKALMIVQVSPTDYNAQESTCSLLFASRVRKCELGKAQKKERSGELEKLKGIAQRSQDKLRGQEDKLLEYTKTIKALQQERDDLAKSVDRMTSNFEQTREGSERQLREDFKQKQEKLIGKIRNHEQEIKSLREKLSNREKSGDGKVARLESRLHDANMEIRNLRQQLRSSICAGGVGSAMEPSSPSPQVTFSSPTAPAPSGTDDKENTICTPEGNVAPGAKHVSFKNTPQIINPQKQRRHAHSRSRLLAPTVASSSHSSTLRKGTSRNKALGTASRVLQTPGRSRPRSAARRIPTERRPKWN